MKAKTKAELQHDVARLRKSLGGLLRVYEFSTTEETRAKGVVEDVETILEETKGE